MNYIRRDNGQVDRHMQTIRNYLRIETQIKSEWPNGLWKIQPVLNTIVHVSKGFTPLQQLLGIGRRTPLIQAVFYKFQTNRKSRFGQETSGWEIIQNA